MNSVRYLKSYTILFFHNNLLTKNNDNNNTNSNNKFTASYGTIYTL